MAKSLEVAGAAVVAAADGPRGVDQGRSLARHREAGPVHVGRAYGA